MMTTTFEIEDERWQEWPEWRALGDQPPYLVFKNDPAWNSLGELDAVSHDASPANCRRTNADMEAAPLRSEAAIMDEVSIPHPPRAQGVRNRRSRAKATLGRHRVRERRGRAEIR